MNKFDEIYKLIMEEIGNPEKIFNQEVFNKCLNFIPGFYHAKEDNADSPFGKHSIKLDKATLTFKFDKNGCHFKNVEELTHDANLNEMKDVGEDFEKNYNKLKNKF